MVAENLVDAAEDTRDIVVHVADTDKVGLVGGDGAEVDLGEVDGADRGAEEQVARDGAGDLLTDHLLRLLRRPADMRREDHVGERPERVRPRVELCVEPEPIRARLRWEHVQRGPSEVLGLDCVDQRGDIDDFAARIVEEVRADLHLRQLRGADHPHRLWRLGHVQGDEVGLLEQRVERVDRPRRAEGHDWDDVVENDAHPECLCEHRELRTDVPVAHNPERIAPDLPAALGDFVPHAVVHLHRVVT